MAKVKDLKKKKKKNEYGVNNNDVNPLSLSDLKVIEVSEPKKVNLMDFEQAHRIYKKNNKISEKWDSDALKVFASKRIKNKLASKDEWFKTFSKY